LRSPRRRSGALRDCDPMREIATSGGRTINGRVDVGNRVQRAGD
jgi:hypothetical protein